MKSTVVDESLSSFKPMYCSREYQTSTKFMLSFTADFLLGVMLFNLFGVFWSAIAETIYSLTYTNVKPPKKMLHFLELLTCSSVDKKFRSHTKFNGPGKNATDLSKNKELNIVTNTMKKSCYRSNSVSALDMMQQENEETKKKKENYITDWRYLTRALEKIFFISSLITITFITLYISLTNYIA